MITDYAPRAVYQIFQKIQSGKLYKIAEIHENICYDIGKNGNRIVPGISFTNSTTFWSNFGDYVIKKVDRPLYGYESIVWGAYWTIQALVTIVCIVALPDLEKIIYTISSGVLFYITYKYRYNKYMIYAMAAVAIIVIILLLTAKVKPKK